MRFKTCKELMGKSKAILMKLPNTDNKIGSENSMQLMAIHFEGENTDFDKQFYILYFLNNFPQSQSGQTIPRICIPGK